MPAAQVTTSAVVPPPTRTPRPARLPPHRSPGAQSQEEIDADIGWALVAAVSLPGSHESRKFWKLRMLELEMPEWTCAHVELVNRSARTLPVGRYAAIQAPAISRF